jgi:hypothetical protein
MNLLKQYKMIQNIKYLQNICKSIRCNSENFITNLDKILTFFIILGNQYHIYIRFNFVILKEHRVYIHIEYHKKKKK